MPFDELVSAAEIVAAARAYEPGTLGADAAPPPMWVPTQLTVGEFLATAGILTLDERKAIVRQALVLLEQNYAHLPLKVAMHGVNPVQRLRLLQARLNRQDAGTADPEWLFHKEMLSIFSSVRDLHTLYLLPAPFADTGAALPFTIEEFFEHGEHLYLVSRTSDRSLFPADTPDSFKQGVVVTHWNGVPIDRAVDVNGDRFAGSNLAARHSRGLAALTSRPMQFFLPPDEEWVTITYLNADGKPDELRMPWLVLQRTVAPPPPHAEAPRGVDLEGERIASLNAHLFPPAKAAAASPSGYTQTGQFLWRTVTTDSGTFGHVRITSFHLEPFDIRQHLVNFLNVLAALPEDGLILDIRSNPGGHIVAGESLLQFLTPRPIRPEPAQMVNTPLNLRLALRAPDNFGPWRESMEQSVETGAVYSGAIALTSTRLVNAIGQVYHGPVVLVTDARCYSTSDIFAAGFADHKIGTILGTEDNTGAGGANVVEQTDLLEALSGDAGTPYQALPRGASMSVAIRRMLRVGETTDGTPLEDLGVKPAERHLMTRADVLNGNPDLMEHAGRILAGMPKYRLNVGVEVGDDSLFVTLDTREIDRVDIYVDDRPRESADITQSPTRVTVDGVISAGKIRVEGFHQGALVAVTTVFTG
ncbi:hypothetical protein J5X84_24430 [Streptosporangiaceae bacterium NEAU-GS5]|nr:hypothetical protein [Streptosporangiaceae bacterium NEAU-GS5]